MDDDIIPLEDFLDEIQSMVQNSTSFLPENIASLHERSKKYYGKPRKKYWYERFFPDDLKKSLDDLYDLMQNIMGYLDQLLDGHFQNIANMLYVYILTGETEEVPLDWISKVETLTINNEKAVFAIASQVANPDLVVQQFREQYKKTFGEYRPKITKLAVSTSYYIRLQRLNKPWNYIVEEFIRLNNLSLPPNRSSEKYVKSYHTYESRLRKRMQRYDTTYDVLFRDIN